METTSTFRNLGKLRGSLLLAAAMLLGGTATAVATHRLVEGAQVVHDAAQARAAGLRARLAAANADEAAIRGRIERFRDLEARGVVGPERRVDWIERIEEVRRARRLLDVRYEFSPQTALDKGVDDISTSGYRFMSSTMQLHMQLLHEEDLFVFLSDLAATVPALLRTRDCVVERTGSAPGRLRAQCILDWITLQKLP